MTARTERHPAAPIAGKGQEGMTEPLDAVRELSAAFAARDLGAALACFAGGDIGYAGSEKAETASGRDAVTALLGELFQRPEAYAWTATASTVHRYGAQAYVFAEAEGEVRTDAGETEAFPYRVSGIVELSGGRWLWRHCQGGEPT
ncbi:nuclear transport factor 2 family protein [Actinoplanes sp. NPDC026619]|uniref:nuclear transport factor 2 family protein n=1 Tax=Actinoplanes sp. NPDC026619 TaxID=3155798 RepID=UPI0033F582E8